jgi:peptidoglycan/LPS O-acetylase OafA/YrhL
MAGWAWTFAMIGLALRFLSGYNAVSRYVADASYWIYLIHMPIVVGLQGLVSTLDWAWPVKLAVILGVSMPVMFASYHLLVRYTIIGEILNGKRAPRPTLALDPSRAFTGVSRPGHA